jgi:hypothetical protein
MHVYAGPEATDRKGSLTVDGLNTSDVVLESDGGKPVIKVKTPQRLWTLFPDSEGQSKAWKKNLEVIIKKLSDT